MNNNFYFCFFIFAILTSITIGMPNDALKQFSTHGMAFVIDRIDDNKEDTMAWILQKMINQESSMIVTTSSLLHLVTIPEDRWLAWELLDYLFVLVPRTFNAISTLKNYTKKLDRTTTPSLALQLGIRTNDLRPFLLTAKNIKTRPAEGTLRNNKKFSQEITDALTNKLFIPRSDYYQNPLKISVPTFSFYMAGHGAADRMCVGLGLEDFRTLLDGFAKTLNIALVFIFSCYQPLTAIDAKEDRSGTIITDYHNQYTAYNLTAQRYPFTIISSVITEGEAEIAGKTTSFDTFFTKTKNAPPIDFYELAKLITPFPSFSTTHANRPLIRLANQDITNVLVPQSQKQYEINIVALGDVLSRAHAADHELNLSRYFGRTPETILMYTRTVPFALRIDRTSQHEPFPNVISMFTGDSLTEYQGGIAAPDYTLTEALRGFTPIKTLGRTKIITIKKLFARNDSDTFGNSHGTVTLPNVIISSIETNASQSQITAFAEYKNTLFKINLNTSTTAWQRCDRNDKNFNATQRAIKKLTQEQAPGYEHIGEALQSGFEEQKKQYEVKQNLDTALQGLAKSLTALNKTILEKKS